MRSGVKEMAVVLGQAMSSIALLAFVTSQLSHNSLSFLPESVCATAFAGGYDGHEEVDTAEILGASSHPSDRTANTCLKEYGG